MFWCLVLWELLPALPSSMGEVSSDSHIAVAQLFGCCSILTNSCKVRWQNDFLVFHILKDYPFPVLSTFGHWHLIHYLYYIIFCFICQEGFQILFENFWEQGRFTTHLFVIFFTNRKIYNTSCSPLLT